MSALAEAPPVRQVESLVTADEVAEVLGVKRSTIYDLARRVGPGRLPSVKVGRQRRFRLSEVDAWLDRERETHNS